MRLDNLTLENISMKSVIGIWKWRLAKRSHKGAFS